MKGMRNKPGEIWIDVFPGKYMLSNMGRWYSIRSQKIIKQHKNSSGYYRADIYINGVRKMVFTHIKVVENFGDCNGNRIPLGMDSLIDNGLSIDHLDANKKNNQFFNLEIVTHKENCFRRDERIRLCSFEGNKLPGRRKNNELL